MSVPVRVDRQVAVDFDALPACADIERWLGTALSRFPAENRHEITARFVERQESQALNAAYRGRDSATNVLSFPFEAPPGIPLLLLGDLIISPHVVAEEAKAQQKRLEDHFAHMIVHGTLHLLGMDHIEDDEAEAMEQLEREILAELGIRDPYALVSNALPSGADSVQGDVEASEEKRTDA